jgi:hypothetical protein
MTVTLTVEPGLNAVVVEGTVPAGADRMAISRVGPSATRAYVRGFEEATVVPGAFLERDFEAPIGVPLTYTVDTWDSAIPATVASETATVTIPSSGCEDTWLTDLARAQNTSKIVIESLMELAYEVPVGIHHVIARRTPIVSSDVARAPTFELDFVTGSELENTRARAILGNGVPVLLRTPPEYGVGSMYFSVTGFAEQRIVKQAFEQARRFAVSCVQVDRPDPLLYVPLAPATYSSLETQFATYALATAAYASYDAMLYDYSGALPSDIVPWPPGDV